MSVSEFPSESNAHRESKLAWAAGFLDGEGCIHIARQRYRGSRSDTFRLGVHVSQNIAEVLEHFRDAVGIYAPIYAIPRAKNQRRQCFTLNFTGHKAVALLLLLRHLLNRKRAEADAALEFWADSRTGLRSDCGTIHPALMGVREHYFNLLMQLK